MHDMFKGLNVGDKIRVDYEEGAIEGTFSIFESSAPVAYGVPVVNTSGCSRRLYNCDAVVKVTVLEKAGTVKNIEVVYEAPEAP